MDRGAWQATVLCHKELDMTEQLSARVCVRVHTHTVYPTVISILIC